LKIEEGGGYGGAGAKGEEDYDQAAAVGG